MQPNVNVVVDMHGLAFFLRANCCRQIRSHPPYIRSSVRNGIAVSSIAVNTAALHTAALTNGTRRRRHLLSGASSCRSVSDHRRHQLRFVRLDGTGSAWRRSDPRRSNDVAYAPGFPFSLPEVAWFLFSSDFTYNFPELQ